MERLKNSTNSTLLRRLALTTLLTLPGCNFGLNTSGTIAAKGEARLTGSVDYYKTGMSGSVDASASAQAYYNFSINGHYSDQLKIEATPDQDKLFAILAGLNQTGDISSNWRIVNINDPTINITSSLQIKISNDGNSTIYDTNGNTVTIKENFNLNPGTYYLEKIESSAYASGTRITYTVQSGDTIYSVGRKFGVAPETIKNANNGSGQLEIGTSINFQIP